MYLTNQEVYICIDVKSFSFIMLVNSGQNLLHQGMKKSRKVFGTGKTGLK